MKYNFIHVKMIDKRNYNINDELFKLSVGNKITNLNYPFIFNLKENIIYNKYSFI